MFEDPFAGVYKKLLFSPDGTRLLGGILVGDAADYGKLLDARQERCAAALPAARADGRAGERRRRGDRPRRDARLGPGLLLQQRDRRARSARRFASGADTLDALKRCTKAGTGCGGCVPLVTDLLKAELKKAGKAVVNHLCEHFPLLAHRAVRDRQGEAAAHVRRRRSRTAAAATAAKSASRPSLRSWPACGTKTSWSPSTRRCRTPTTASWRTCSAADCTRSCRACPAARSRPRSSPSSPTSPKKYNLYTKITGGQRIDMFGARVQDLPDIWEELVDAGFESGHAYGKALRTVKSCVGTTWCRYGVQDSVGFAIRVENRYKGIRAPHKIKMAVSGCIRECAEAQGKDVGLIATEKGYNLYVCGNGGSKPRHADLLAADLDEETALKYIDRFLMYYIMTADRLTRTSRLAARSSKAASTTSATSSSTTSSASPPSSKR